MDAVTNVSLGIAFVAGFLSFISPCVLPLIPAYITYLGGRAARQTSMELSAATMGAPGGVVVSNNRVGMFLHGLSFVAGFTLVFVVFGILTNAVLSLRNEYVDVQRFIGRWGGLLIIFFGLHIMGITGWILRKLMEATKRLPPGNARDVFAAGIENILTILYGDTRRQVNPRNPYGYAGSAIMGVTFAAGWTPCVGPIYGAILTMAHYASVNNNYGQVASVLLAYSLGLGVPFLVASLALERLRGLLKRIQRQMRMIEIISGVLLIVIGYLLFTNRFAYINQFAVGLTTFSDHLEGCVTGFLQGDVPGSDYNLCMDLGFSQYKENMRQSPTSQMPLVLLSNGQALVIRTS
jgi:cytochrome c-type biogenesis protein